jgi:two-component system sensor histidine kinase SenX3
VEISVRPVDGMVELAVKDEGVGLSTEEYRHIWDRFYRSPHHTAISGAGLGLWITRALVTACGGEVDAFSAGTGRGATMSIRLAVPQRQDQEQIRASDED